MNIFNYRTVERSSDFKILFSNHSGGSQQKYKERGTTVEFCVGFEVLLPLVKKRLYILGHNAV
jgi:hypothetical protein